MHERHNGGERGADPAAVLAHERCRQGLGVPQEGFRYCLGIGLGIDVLAQQLCLKFHTTHVGGGVLAAGARGALFFWLWYLQDTSSPRYWFSYPMMTSAVRVLKEGRV